MIDLVKSDQLENMKNKSRKIILISALVLILLSLIYAYLDHQSPFLKTVTVRGNPAHLASADEKRMEFVIESRETVVSAYLNYSGEYPNWKGIQFRLMDDEGGALRSGTIVDIGDRMGKQNGLQFLFGENLKVPRGSKLVITFEKFESAASVVEIELFCREHLLKSLVRGD